MGFNEKNREGGRSFMRIKDNDISVIFIKFGRSFSALNLEKRGVPKDRKASTINRRAITASFLNKFL